MEKIQFDSGVRSYELGSGVLRFNPADPNLFARFMEAQEKICQVEQQLLQQAQSLPQDGENALQLLQQADKELKAIFSWVFGGDNDFDRLLGGVNLLATGKNGQRVVSNLLSALQPILLSGAESCVREKVAKARKPRSVQ